MSLAEACYNPIKLARPADADELCAHLRGIDEGFGNGRPSDALIEEVVKSVCRGDRMVAALVRERGRIVASTGLSINKLWYSDEFLLADMWHYVSDAYRKSPYAKTLLRFAKTYADKLAVPLVMTIENSEALQPKIRLYEREFTPYGGLFEAPPEDTPPPEGVYLASQLTWPEVERIARWLGEDNALIPVNYDEALRQLHAALNAQGSEAGNTVIGLAGTPNDIKGAIVLRVQQGDSGHWRLAERFIAVPPGEHTYGTSAKLMAFARWAAGKMNLPLDIGVSSRKRTEAKLRLYRRQFGEPKRLFFYYKG